VFGDSLAVTVSDPDHSIGEERFTTIGQSSSGQLLVVCHIEQGDTIRKTMKRKTMQPEMRTEYDFSGGMRGKYYNAIWKAAMLCVGARC
jgi:uncharacterized DUF497 family protein